MPTLLNKFESLFVADTKPFDEAVDKSERKVKSFGGIVTRSFSKANRVMGDLSGTALRFTRNMGLAMGVFTGAGLYGAKQLANNFIATGESMDKLKMSLDTITQGEGAEWFDKLNDWAMTMPINTEKAIESFSMMRAMGLKPSIDDMTTLVDATNALGGGSDVMDGIARALGQIQTKGKVSAEELMQLAERGIPAYDILREKLGLTAEQVANIGNQGISGAVAVEALLSGMSERFGGMSDQMQNKWGGLKTTMMSYWTEFKRLAMDSGIMEALENGLKNAVNWLEKFHSSGAMKAFAQKIADSVIPTINKFSEQFQSALQWIASEGVGLIEGTVQWLGSAAVAIADFFGTVIQWIDQYRPVISAAMQEIKYLGEEVFYFFEAMAPTIKGVMEQAIGFAQKALKVIGPILKLVASSVAKIASLVETASINRESMGIQLSNQANATELNQRVEAMGFDSVSDWEAAGAPSDQPSATTTNMYFNQSISRSDVSNIAAEQKRQGARS